MGREGRFTKGHRNFGEVMDIFTILIVVMVSQVLLWVKLSPQNSYFAVLSPSTSECDLIWKQSLQRHLVEMKLHWNRVGP